MNATEIKNCKGKIKKAMTDVGTLLRSEQERFNTMDEFQCLEQGHGDKAVTNILTLETLSKNLNQVLKTLRTI